MKTNQPSQLRYSINESLAAAEALEHPEFQHLRKEWRIKVEKGGIVAMKKLIVEDIVPTLEFEFTDQFDVMETIIKNIENKFVLTFPNIVSIDGLEQFLTKYEYEFNSENGLKITAKKEDQNDG